MAHFVLTSLITLFLLLPLRMLAQDSRRVGSYYSVFLEVPVSKKWSWFNENELRGINVLGKYYYFEIKSGVNYKSSGRTTFTLALGVYNTFDEGVDFEGMKKKTDYRFWQQMNHKQPFFSGVIEHRVRAEEVINNNFRPSIRYRLQPKWPLNNKGLATGGLFATVYDELFLQFESPAFRRNRIFGGFGYYISNRVVFQSGLLRQTDYKTGAGNFAKNFFYISGSFKL